ncbi:hypothetical protein THAOC_26270, partial [Thalassiosira oceanica]
QVKRVWIRLDQQLDDVDTRLVARGHVEREASVLVAVSRPLGEVHEEHLDGVGRGLPHSRLVEWEVAHAVGLGGTLGVRLEERVDDVLRRLEGAGGMEGEVTSVVDAGGLLGELGSQTPQTENPIALDHRSSFTEAGASLESRSSREVSSRAHAPDESESESHGFPHPRPAPRSQSLLAGVQCPAVAMRNPERAQEPYRKHFRPASQTGVRIANVAASPRVSVAVCDSRRLQMTIASPNLEHSRKSRLSCPQPALSMFSVEGHAPPNPRLRLSSDTTLSQSSHSQEKRTLLRLSRAPKPLQSSCRVVSDMAPNTDGSIEALRRNLSPL